MNSLASTCRIANTGLEGVGARASKGMNREFSLEMHQKARVFQFDESLSGLNRQDGQLTVFVQVALCSACAEGAASRTTSASALACLFAIACSHDIVQRMTAVCLHMFLSELLLLLALDDN